MRATEPEAAADALRLRVAELEAHVTELQRQLGEQAARANAAIAAAEDRSYWLDRWHLDLNAVMRRPGAARARAIARILRGVMRRARRATAALRHPG